ncbi:hypothetical protein XH88_07770 [Bradyrhizobium sp. CCBAU 51627]|nr:hypothetical protein [Bradyrhizobium sp. CCBAU 51627]
MAKPLSLEVLASSASLEGRRPGCIEVAHPSRLPARCFASRASHLSDDGTNNTPGLNQRLLRVPPVRWVERGPVVYFSR